MVIRVNSSETLTTSAEGQTRREFVKKVAGVTGAGLVHFTILGSFAPLVHAATHENEDNCASACPADGGSVDICSCTSGDSGSPKRDFCNCGDDHGTQDICDCGTETSSDTCSCGSEDQNYYINPADKCNCPPEGATVDCCWCSTFDPGPEQPPNPGGAKDVCTCGNDGEGKDYCSCEQSDSNNSDNCTCGDDRGSAKDYCSCSQNDISSSDNCICGRDSDDGGADYCSCGTETNSVDTCAICSTESDHHDDPGNSNMNSCSCQTEGQSVDACLCWYEGFNNPRAPSSPAGCPNSATATSRH